MHTDKFQRFEEHLIKRREALKKMALAGAGMLALKNLSPSAWAAPAATDGMPMSTLGRTGVRVSKIGLGAASLAKDDCSPEEAQRIIVKALDAGINYVDTAPNYTQGESERRVGQALKGKRDQVFLVSKTESDSYEGTMDLLQKSLERLQTDYLDLVHLHNFGHERRWKDHEFAFSDEGAMGALREAKQKGMVRFIGASGHVYPSRFKVAIDSGEIDVLMLAVNYVNQHTYDFESKVWMPATKQNIGLVSMKVFGGRSGKTGRFRLPAEDYDMALRYTLSLKGLHTAVVGIGHTDHLDQLLETFRRVDALDEDEMAALAQRGLNVIEADESLRAAHGRPLT